MHPNAQSGSAAVGEANHSFIAQNYPVGDRYLFLYLRKHLALILCTERWRLTEQPLQHRNLVDELEAPTGRYSRSWMCSAFLTSVSLVAPTIAIHSALLNIHPKLLVKYAPCCARQRS